MKHLCNTLVYNGVTAQSTARSRLSDSMLGDILSATNLCPEIPSEVDPLLGCAASLFPLSAQVGSLIQEVRSSKSNSLITASKAAELKANLAVSLSTILSATLDPLNI